MPSEVQMSEYDELDNDVVAERKLARDRFMLTIQYNLRKGMGFGAFAGFIASIAFIGVMLWMPLVLSLSVGVFLHALGLSVFAPVVNGDTVGVGLVAFGLVLAQGVLVLEWLHPESKSCIFTIKEREWQWV